MHTTLHPSAMIVLGLPWLCSTKPVIDWATLSITSPLGTASTLPTVTVTMACTMIPPSDILDTIPKLHTASMPPPLSVLGSKLSPPSSGYILNTAIGHSLHISMLPPDAASSTTPIPNLSGYEQTFDMDGEPILLCTKPKGHCALESPKPSLIFPLTLPGAKNLIQTGTTPPKTAPKNILSSTHLCTPTVETSFDDGLPFSNTPQDPPPPK